MRRTLALLAVASTSMVTLAFLIPLALVVKETAYDRATGDAQRQASALVPVLVITWEHDKLMLAIRQTDLGAQDRIAVHLGNGTKVGNARAPQAEVDKAFARARSDDWVTKDDYYLLRPVTFDRDRMAVIEVRMQASELSRGVAPSWAVLTGVASVLVLGSVFVGDRLGARLVLATQRLGEAATRLGKGDLSVRIQPAGPHELVKVGAAFNRMADRVNQLLSAEREMAADLSHRLRTPLTALRLTLDHLGPGAEPSKAALGRLEHEVDAIISAARQPSRTVGFAHCDAAEVLRTRVAFWSALAEDQHRAWELIGASEPVPAPVAATELSAVIDALLGNVFRHTPEGSAFTVTLHQGSGMVGILVADAGHGIPDPEIALERGASGSGSTGLGLDIARRLAESTGGSLRIRTSSWGGAQIQLWLRTAEQPQSPPNERRLVRRKRA
ncbi:sensor histidine kinase [Sinosporangium siamense]|uniref:Signal transduction histidine-protein kinase/phosphatase MprB n=1 Tax=Sinosporangium siamense TaxID=1367973 RepID=A0A919RS20_9ACTN|nr:HAMP domain-containing sensor histidine kinase [Sinosporangium siamense]GII97224.1 two-component sensor histidine kinase [Sinosporangium siamense]